MKIIHLENEQRFGWISTNEPSKTEQSAASTLTSKTVFNLHYLLFFI